MAKDKIFNRYILWFTILISTVIFYNCISISIKEEPQKNDLNNLIVDKDTVYKEKLVLKVYYKILKENPIKDKVESKSPQQRLVEAYSAFNGIEEKTGNNDGERVEYILNTVGLKKGDQWCAAMVYASFYDAGLSDSVPKSGYSPSFFPARKTIYIKGTKGEFDNSVQTDLVGFYIPSKGRIGHIGFLHDVNIGKNTCITFEGNTSLVAPDGSQQEYDGQGACFKKRLKTSIRKISRWL